MTKTIKTFKENSRQKYHATYNNIPWLMPNKTTLSKQSLSTSDPHQTAKKNQKTTTTITPLKTAKPKKKSIEDNYYFPISTNYTQLKMTRKQANSEKDCCDKSATRISKN
jgi:hypothetical protein